MILALGVGATLLAGGHVQTARASYGVDIEIGQFTVSPAHIDSGSNVVPTGPNLVGPGCQVPVPVGQAFVTLTLKNYGDQKGVALGGADSFGNVNDGVEVHLPQNTTIVADELGCNGGGGAYGPFEPDMHYPNGGAGFCDYDNDTAAIQIPPVGEHVLTCPLYPLGPGETETVFFFIQVPYQSSTSMTAKVDPGHNEFESVATARDPVTQTIAIDQPDLIASFPDSSSPRATSAPGSQLTYHAVIKNGGPGSTPWQATWRTRFDLSGSLSNVLLQNATRTGAGVIGCQYAPAGVFNGQSITCDTTPFGPGEQADVFFTGTAPSSGAVQVDETVDTTNVVAETNRDNNRATVVTNIVADTTPPAVVGLANRLPDSNGWYNHLLSVKWSGTDPDDAAGSLSCSPPSIYAGPDAPGALLIGHCVDPAGNTGSGTFALKYDSTAPSISCGAADAAWHGSDVSIACSASDTGSGLANPGDASFSLTTTVPAGTATASAATNVYQVCDVAGNCATAGPITGIMVDKAPPTVICGASDGKWHGTDVGIACTAADVGSGLAGASDASFSLLTNVPAGTDTANAATSTRSVCDAVGNCATAGPVTGIKVDKSPPAVNCGAPDDAWHAVDVTIPCTASDSGAGLAPASDASFGLSTNVTAGSETGNASTGTHQVCDAVGNCAMAGPIAGNKIDKAPPAISCGSADGLWHAGEISIACAASDHGSGLGNAADASFSLTTAVAANTETANAATGTHAVCDALGNCATAGPIAGNRIDKKAPTTTATTTRVPAPPGAPTVQLNLTAATVTPGGSLGPVTCWSGGGVVVNLAALDGGSGPAAITYSISGAQATAATTVAGDHATITVSKFGASTITYYAVDNVGNVEPGKKLLILNGGLLSCATVPAALTVPAHGTVNLVGTLSITIGSTTTIRPFNLTLSF